jgi:adenine-specific DNA-methyltransferase
MLAVSCCVKHWLSRNSLKIVHMNDLRGIKELCETEALPSIIQTLASTRPSGWDPAQLYPQALEIVVDELLAGAARQSASRGFPLPRFLGKDAPVLSPQQVGDVYEYFRGFRLDLSAGGVPVLSRCNQGKRNQGLFYTPEHIVRRIVHSSLDALEISEPEDYLCLRILDPAVGTGTFLLEALEQITQRVLAAAVSGQSGAGAAVAAVCEEVRSRVQSHRVDTHVDEEAALRLHLMSRCLYGVDLDGIAVNIARAALRDRALKGLPLVPGLEPLLRIGNALIGQAQGDPATTDPNQEDARHAAAYFGHTGSDRQSVLGWSHRKKMMHWPLEYPEIFRSSRGGFDCVIGNPPYEIVSVKESGIDCRRQEQAYFRAMYETCQGKINTYRLMIERGLTLLRNSGVLGFIVPATLLADSTAGKLRRMILDGSEVREALLIPEKARAFAGVTQAFVILVCRKGRSTLTLEPVEWKGTGPVHKPAGVSIDRKLLEATDFRIPCLRSSGEKALLKALARHPPLWGSSPLLPVGRIHQGEVNLTVHRRFITTSRTGHPLIRGEHVMPLRVSHPSAKGGRLDWVVPEFPALYRDRQKRIPLEPRLHFGLNPWDTERIALGRVVNMDTDRRLKAAAVPSGCFLGDMTNYITDVTVPRDYLLGLLNSRLLNWRLKLTSTNNYLSAAEIAALPIPRISVHSLSARSVSSAQEKFAALFHNADYSMAEWVARIQELMQGTSRDSRGQFLAHIIEWTVEQIRKGHGNRKLDTAAGIWNALDAAVLLLYECERFGEVLL